MYKNLNFGYNDFFRAVIVITLQSTALLLAATEAEVTSQEKLTPLNHTFLLTLGRYCAHTCTHTHLYLNIYQNMVIHLSENNFLF